MHGAMAQRVQAKIEGTLRSTPKPVLGGAEVGWLKGRVG